MPSSLRSGTSVMPANGARSPRSRARGRSPWATITHSTPAAASCSTPGADGAVEPLPGLPHDGCSERLGPCRHLRIVADDRDGERGARSYDVFRHGSNKVLPRLIGHGPAQPAFGLSEPLDRDEHDFLPEVASGRSGWSLRVGGHAGGHWGQCKCAGPWRPVVTAVGSRP